MKEKLFNMFDAKHDEGIRAGFGLVLTYMMLSRAGLVNSYSPEVDLGVRYLHTQKTKQRMCVHGR